MSAITLRDLTAIPAGKLKGVGDKRLASLATVGIENVFDLLTTYPRRWVDRTNEARIADLEAGEEALVLATDGLSEQGIGVADPAAVVAEAVAQTRDSKPELRPLELGKRVSHAAMAAQREQAAGDNIGCAVLWLGDVPL